MMVSDMVIQILARIGLAPHHETAVGHTKILKENCVAARAHCSHVAHFDLPEPKVQIGV